MQLVFALASADAILARNGQRPRRYQAARSLSPILIARRLRPIAIALTLCLAATAPLAAGNVDAGRTGYCRYPAVHGDTLLFTSEGDLWSVSSSGGIASRLTSNTGIESMATISPDGEMVAFRAQYEGPSEFYTMPIHGGIPQRRT